MRTQLLVAVLALVGLTSGASAECYLPPKPACMQPFGQPCTAFEVQNYRKWMEILRDCLQRERYEQQQRIEAEKETAQRSAWYP